MSSIEALWFKNEAEWNKLFCTFDVLDNMCYSQVPIKWVGPNKRVGWVFYVNFIKK